MRVEMYEDILRDIRKHCRMAMNGVTSTSMRQRGLKYKVNFGLSIQQIRELANRYQADEGLAETLWKEDTRELKILSTLIYPVEKFSVEQANKWIQEIPNQEIREQICINLLQNLPFAPNIAPTWSNHENKELRTTGYWLIARLLLAKKVDFIDINSFAFIWEDANSLNTFLRNASILALKHIGRQSKETADIILQKLFVSDRENDMLKQETYGSLSFEFEFYFEE